MSAITSFCSLIVPSMVVVVSWRKPPDKAPLRSTFSAITVPVKVGEAEEGVESICVCIELVASKYCKVVEFNTTTLLIL